jgi:uncharacterized protein (TIGR02588 family)
VSGDRRKIPPAERSAAEWVSLGVALVLLAGVIGTVVALWLSPSQDAPRFTVEHGETRREAGRFYLAITVHNDGDRTASEVTVVGVVAANGREETATTTFDFIPGHTKVEGVLIFGQDPSGADVRVVSYQKP